MEQRVEVSSDTLPTILNHLLLLIAIVTASILSSCDIEGQWRIKMQSCGCARPLRAQLPSTRVVSILAAGAEFGLLWLQSIVLHL